jgi:hypothetical protein
MKKLLLFLLVLIPCFSFGQSIGKHDYLEPYHSDKIQLRSSLYDSTGHKLSNFDTASNKTITGQWKYKKNLSVYDTAYGYPFGIIMSTNNSYDGDNVLFLNGHPHGYKWYNDGDMISFMWYKNGIAQGMPLWGFEPFNFNGHLDWYYHTGRFFIDSTTITDSLYNKRLYTKEFHSDSSIFHPVNESTVSRWIKIFVNGDSVKIPCYK